MIREPQICIGEFINDEVGEFDRFGFKIIRITELAKRMHRNIYKNQDGIVGKIQKWYDELPEVKPKDDLRKMIQHNGQKYAFTPSHGMRDVYGYFDSVRKSGCLMMIQKIKTK